MPPKLIKEVQRVSYKLNDHDSQDDFVSILKDFMKNSGKIRLIECNEITAREYMGDNLTTVFICPPMVDKFGKNGTRYAFMGAPVEFNYVFEDRVFRFESYNEVE